MDNNEAIENVDDIKVRANWVFFFVEHLFDKYQLKKTKRN